MTPSPGAEPSPWPSLHVRRLGSDGPPLMLLHGFGADGSSWMTLESTLSSRARVLAVDLPGHGRSPDEVGDGRLEALCEPLSDLMLTESEARWHLIGHSLGGALAWLLAHQWPRRIASLTLIAPVGLGQGVDRDFLEQFPQVDSAARAQELLQRLVEQPRLIGRSLSAGVAAQMAVAQRRQALGEIARGITHFEQHTADSLLTASSLDAVPRMVLWGEADRLNPPDRQRLAGWGGEFHPVSQAGHLPQIEQIRSVQYLIADFLDRNTAAAT